MLENLIKKSALLCSALALCACANDLSYPLQGSSQPTSDETKTSLFACEDASLVGKSAIRRLSKTEVFYSLVDFIDDRYSVSLRSDIKDELESAFLSLPSENEPGDLEEIKSGFLTAHLIFAAEMAEKLTQDSARLSSLGYVCDDSSPEYVDCLSQTTREIWQRLWRRAVTDSELNDFVASTDTEQEVFARSSLLVGLTHPAFLTVTEFGDTKEGQSKYLSKVEFLTRFSLATRMALPDQALIDQIPNLNLTDEEALKLFVSAQLSDSRSLRGLMDFFESYINAPSLGTAEFPQETYDLAAYKFDFDSADLDKLKADSLSESEAFLLYLYQSNESFEELFKNRKLTVESEVLRSIYQLSNSTSTTKPSELAGILGLARLNFSGGAQTRPIGRGTRILQDYLCIEPGDPVDADVDGEALSTIGDREEFSTIEITESLTADPGCQSCHAQINPVGFAFESIGPFGELRDVETVLDPDTATPIAFHSINVSEKMSLGGTTKNGISGPSSFINFALQSKQLQKCYAEKLLSYQMKRQLDFNQDACGLETIAQLAVSKEIGLQDLYVNWLTSEAFRRVNK